MSKIVPKMLQLDSLPLDLWLIITTTNELIKPIAIKSHALGPNEASIPLSL